jgi:hypothetical protein
MMVEIVDHPGEWLWEVEKGRTPKTGEDWYELENHAIALAGAATLIQLGGTGPEDAKWASQPEWKTSAQQLASAALTARQAAKSRDLAALIEANGKIVDACESSINSSPTFQLEISSSTIAQASIRFDAIRSFTGRNADAP